MRTTKVKLQESKQENSKFLKCKSPTRSLILFSFLKLLLWQRLKKKYEILIRDVVEEKFMYWWWE